MRAFDKLNIIIVICFFLKKEYRDIANILVWRPRRHYINMSIIIIYDIYVYCIELKIINYGKKCQ